MNTELLIVVLIATLSTVSTQSTQSPPRTPSTGYTTSSTLTSTTDCGGHFFSPTGQITSPNYPLDYPPNTECVWIIEIPEGQKVQLHVLDIELQDDPNCLADYLEIRLGNRFTTTNFDFLNRYCGASDIRLVLSGSNKIYLKFKSDSTISSRGFSLSWDPIVMEGTTRRTTSWPIFTSSRTTQRPTTLSTSRPITTSTTSTPAVEPYPVCGGHIIQSSGSLSYPNSKGSLYPHNADCVWIIATPEEGKLLDVTFTRFNLEKSTSCSYDWLQINEETLIHDDNIRRHCGSDKPKGGRFMSTTGSLFLWFHSDFSISGEGFGIEWNTVEPGCGGTLKDSFGLISSPLYPKNYGDNLRCTWVIGVRPGQLIQLTWTSFALENHQSCTYDSVSVYDNSSYSNLGSYCGQSIPPVMTSTGNVMTIVLSTDGSITSKGFNLYYETIDAAEPIWGTTNTLPLL